MAAIGTEQLKRFDELSEKRKLLAKKYDQLLDSTNIIKFNRNYDLIVPHIYVVKLDKNADRKEIQKKLFENGIEVGYHYQPNHLLSFYKSKANLVLDNSESIFPKLLTLPLHPDLTMNEIEYVVEKLDSATK